MRKGNPAVIAQRNRRYHAANRERINARQRVNRLFRKNDPEQWVRKRMLGDARSRARKSGVPFTITLSDIPMTKICPVFGFALDWHNSKMRKDESPSVDRIHNRIGYIPGNVWVISWRANNIKGDASPAELRLVADAVDRVGKKAAGRLLDGVEHNAYLGEATLRGARRRGGRVGSYPIIWQEIT